MGLLEQLFSITSRGFRDFTLIATRHSPAKSLSPLAHQSAGSYPFYPTLTLRTRRPHYLPWSSGSSGIMESPPRTLQQGSPEMAGITQKLTGLKMTPDGKGKETIKPRRRVSGLKLKAKQQPAAQSGQRRFALRLSQSADDIKYQGVFQSIGLVSKELPKVYSSDRIFEWRAFELERTPMAQLEYDATPYQDLEHFVGQVYEAIASPDHDDEDRYLIWSKVTRSIMAHRIDPARINGTIPKAARFTHFVPSNLLIVKIPVDCHSSAGYLDLVTKPAVGWAYAMGLGRELKLCGNTRYIAKGGDSAVEGVDFDQPHPALAHMAAANPGVVDGFGSFNESEIGFRPFRPRPFKFDAPSVVVESTYGSDVYPLRYKACWWLQLMADQVKAVLLVAVDPAEQKVVVEVWRNELPDMYATDEGPTRAQKVVVVKRDEFRGVNEEANAGHYRVEGGPLVVRFEDFWLRKSSQEKECDLVIGDETLAQEVADLWFGDSMVVNDWELE